MPSLKQSEFDFSHHLQHGKRLDSLRNRAGRCVCRYCGQSLELRKLTYAAYDEAKIELYCSHCDRIENGVEPEIYKIARYFVEEMQYDHYPWLDFSSRKQQMNTAIISDILTWGFSRTGLLDEDGFQMPIQIDNHLLGEALFISDTTLKAYEGEDADER